MVENLEKHVIVVDDEPMFLESISEHLALFGIKVQTASSSDEAMKVLVEQKFDLLITDVKMPGGTGYDLAGLARFVDGNIPVILISGDDPEDVMKQASHGAGVSCCLSKVDVKGLLKTVLELLGLEEMVETT